LSVYRHHGEYWVAGRPGARFSVMIRNRGDERILAVTAVDGINVISGKTAAWLQTGYVFDARERYDIPGWRKNQSEVADFNFTAASESYAARTDRPANVGVIGVAVFLEQKPKIAAVPKEATVPDSPSFSNAPPAPAADASSRSAGAASLAQSARSAIAENFASPERKLGTGHGAREVSYVHDVPFERASSTPNEVIRIRYDSLENLIAMGVVSQRTTPWPAPNAFPDSDPRYVPDPPGG